MLVVSISLVEFVLVRFFFVLSSCCFCAFVLILENLCSYYYLLDYPLSLPTSFDNNTFSLKQAQEQRQQQHQQQQRNNAPPIIINNNTPPYPPRPLHLSHQRTKSSHMHAGNKQQFPGSMSQPIRTCLLSRTVLLSVVSRSV